MRLRILTLWVLSLCLAPMVLAEDAPKDQVVIELKRPVWEPMVWINQVEPPADNVAIDLSGEHPIFTSHEAGANGVFEYRFHSPIDTARYPLLTIKYKAKNLDISKDKAGISLDDTAGRGAKKDTLLLNQFVSDGEEHELQKDLREIQPRGTIGRIVISLIAAEAGDASIELASVVFDVDPAAPAVEVKDDSALQIAVFDKEGQPIKGAKVTVDAERKGAARSGETDDKGEVSITPRETETGPHALQVEAEGKATYYATVAKGAPGANVNMTAGASYGGIVKNEDGQPIEGATVRIFAPPPSDSPAPSDSHMLRRAVMKTDAEGKFKSPVLPEGEAQVITKLAHPDYISDKEYRNKEDEPPLEEMKAGTGVMVLKK